MDLRKILAINLKYYRQKYNLSQEKFAEILGTTLSYLNQIENCRVDVRCSTIDKFVRNIKKYDHKLKLKSEDLVTYRKSHLTNYKRIDEKVKVSVN